MSEKKLKPGAYFVNELTDKEFESLFARRPTTPGAYFVNELTDKDFENLCARRPTTQNEYAHITHEAVMAAADEIGKRTQDAFKAWLHRGSVVK